MPYAFGPIISLYFNPRAPRGARRKRVLLVDNDKQGFQSTRSARSATLPICITPHGAGNFNPRAPRGARLLVDGEEIPVIYISIHALREERDGAVAYIVTANTGDFNPRAPRGARRPVAILVAADGADFNPRAPRGARHHHSGGNPRDSGDFNPRAPRGARLLSHCDSYGLRQISIHALREERDASIIRAQTARRDFNPRAPRGARPERQ